MIGYIIGFIIDITNDGKLVILTRGGVGYELNCATSIIESLKFSDYKSQEYSFFVDTIVREDAITLYGFQTSQEKSIFRLVTKINGVGPKVALSILSSLNARQLYAALMAEDIASFKRINGVGPKMASRIITELKDKAEELLQFNDNSTHKIAVTMPHSATQQDTPKDKMHQTKKDAQKSQQETPEDNNLQKSRDAMQALEVLGFSKSETYAMIQNKISEDTNISVENLIKRVLSELS